MKPNLVLLPSYATNDIVLDGLIKYLQRYFNVYPINLPGFAKEAEALEDVTFESFGKHISSKIKDLHLETYLVMTISFSYGVLCFTDLKSCNGVIAITPYIGKEGMKQHWIYNVVVRFFNKSPVLKLVPIIWKTRFLNFINRVLIHRSPDIFELVKSQTDPITFVKAARLIFNNKSVLCLPDLPHVICLGKNDSSINYEYAHKFFSGLKSKEFVELDLEHFPKDISEQYFESKIDENKIKNILEFFK